jgi:hypothetical protein
MRDARARERLWDWFLLDLFQGVSRFGAKPKPTVIVRKIENGKVVLLPVRDAFPSP